MLPARARWWRFMCEADHTQVLVPRRRSPGRTQLMYNKLLSLFRTKPNLDVLPSTAVFPPLIDLRTPIPTDVSSPPLPSFRSLKPNGSIHAPIPSCNLGTVE